MLINLPTRQDDLDPRVWRTRQFLQQALKELASEKGFQSITVQDITQRAGINRSTFYAHFQDKYELLEYAIREDFRATTHQKLPDPTCFSPANLETLLRTVCEFVSQVNHHCRPLDQQFETFVEKQMKSELYNILYGWFEQSSPLGQAGGSAALPAMMSSWAIYGAVLQWVQKTKPEPVEAFVAQLLPLIRTHFTPTATSS